MATQGSSMLSNSLKDMSLAGSSVIRGGMVTLRPSGPAAGGNVFSPLEAVVVEAALLVVGVVVDVVVADTFCAIVNWHTKRFRTAIQLKMSPQRWYILED